MANAIAGVLFTEPSEVACCNVTLAEGEKSSFPRAEKEGSKVKNK